MINEDKFVECVNFHEMKTLEVTNSTSLKDLVTLANQECEVVLTQDNRPVAKVQSIAQLQKSPDGLPRRRELGLHRGPWMVAEDFDEPLTDEFWLGEK